MTDRQAQDVVEGRAPSASASYDEKVAFLQAKGMRVRGDAIGRRTNSVILLPREIPFGDAPDSSRFGG
jgi:hypothetical protein